MMYAESGVIAQYRQALDGVTQAMSAAIAVDHAVQPRITRVDQWVRVQTMRQCLARELRLRGQPMPLTFENLRLCGRRRLDLTVGKLAIVIAPRAVSGARAARLAECRAVVDGVDGIYLYLADGERHQHRIDATEAVFGRERTFLLDRVGDWARWVEFVAANWMFDGRFLLGSSASTAAVDGEQACP